MANLRLLGTAPSAMVYLSSRVALAIALITTGCSSAATPQPTSEPAASAKSRRPVAIRTGLTPEAVATTIRSKQGFAGCYVVSESANSGTPGVITLEFEIDASGQVVSAEPAEQELSEDPGTLPPLDDAALAECLVQVVRKTRFPKAQDRTLAFYTFRFKGDPSRTPEPDEQE